MSVPPLLAIDETLERMSGDMELLSNLFGLFQSDAPKKLTSISQFETAGDMYQVSRIAHSLKGASATVGASRLCQAAIELEQRAKAEDTAGLAAKRQELEDICRQTLDAMHKFCAEAGQS